MSEAVAVAAESEELVLEVTEDAARLVERMTDELGLWETEVDAGLFLAGLAVAHEEDPVPAEDRDPAEQTLGPLSDSAVDDLDHLAILGILDGDDPEPSDSLAEELPGWVEAGADVLGPRLDGADAVEATAVIAELAREL